MPQPVRELADGDHCEEDTADGQHHQDRLLALFGGGRREQVKRNEHQRNLPQPAAVRGERPLDRLGTGGGPGGGVESSGVGAEA